MKVEEHKKEFDKLYNFRDIGGLKTADGRVMKPGILYRSDALSNLSKADIARLKTYQFQLICDLRTVNEQKSKPDRFPDSKSLRFVHVPVHHGSQDFTFKEFFQLLVGKSKELDFEQVIYDLYSCLAMERQVEIKQVLTLVAEAGHIPAVIHCTGGKDRTGFIAALLQLLSGVPYEAVVEQYLLSNDLIGPRMKKIERFIRWMSLFQLSSEQIKPLLIVKREYLDSAIHQILQEYESVDKYLIEKCEVEERTIERLREILIE